ncbi:divergent polysaccharide deacetylase family protein [Gemmobacter sp. 24YEA27]|uniref:divergent polysaccharide deacetylase family protein n=1 Tax=Gemmobacter sp. 24YEA27 TaxID=3040672 RepID=UPI0024B37868|nr:divergent polysaccharide deacetylase family protein [Gemmobacter sp. 24YEA27]
MFGRFLLGAGLGGLVGTGVLALVSVSLSGPFPQNRSAGTLRTEVGIEDADARLAPDAKAVTTETAAETAAVVDPVADPAVAGIPTAPSLDAPGAPEETETAKPSVPEDKADPDFAAAPNLIDLPELALEHSSDPALAAALEAALDAGDRAPGLVPDQPADLADAASDAVPEAPAAPEAAPLVAGVTEGPDTVATPPAELAGLPETPALPQDGLADGETGVAAAGTTVSRPAGPAEDSAPALASAPEPPPLTVEEERMLAQMAADPLPQGTEPAKSAPVAGDGFVILEDVPTPSPAEAAADTALADAAGDGQVAVESLPADRDPAADTADPSPDSGGPETGAASDPAAVKMLTLDDKSSLPGNGTISRETGDGSTRLPRIGETPEEAAAESTAIGSDAPRILFARDFANPANKPRFAVILLDDGSPELDRAALADLPFAVSFAIDPQLPNASEIAALYRAAGQEVIMVASGLPKGAAASDVAVAFSAMAQVLPEAVATMDAPGRSFQADRPLASLVVPEIAAQGRGLITWNIGLNAADQVAKREDVPAAVIFRDLDAEGEEAPVIRRYLDRAAFKAAQDGGVTVFGRASHAATVTALLEWAVEGRAASVELAPVTAMLDVD